MSLILAIVVDDVHFLWIIFSGILVLIGVAVMYPCPGKIDIAKGTAQYQENHHVVLNEQGDTVKSYKTYEIVWKEEYPYGRKK